MKDKKSAAYIEIHLPNSPTAILEGKKICLLMETLHSNLNRVSF